MSDWPRIVDDQYGGDPFVKLVECGGKHYLLNEGAMIEQEEMMYRSFEMDLRLKTADSLRRLGIPW